MEINKAQRESYNLLEKINNKFNVKHDSDTIFLHLAEEIGEVARELSKKQENWREKFDNEKLGGELADVMFDLFSIAEDNNINMEEAFTKKMKKAEEKFELQK